MPNSKSCKRRSPSCSSSDSDCSSRGSKGSRRNSKRGSRRGSKNSRRRSKGSKCCKITDCYAKEVEKVWKDCFCTARLLPVIGYPDCNHGVMTLTHAPDDGKIKVDGLCSNSIVLNNAFYSSECVDGKYLNLYRVTLEDIPGKCGRLSTVQIYVNELAKLCLDVAGNGYSFTGQSKHKKAKTLATVQHQNVGMSPMEFTKRTLHALKRTLKVIRKREHGSK